MCLPEATFRKPCAPSTGNSAPPATPRKSLFRDDQRMVLRHILDSTLEEAETAFRQIHEHHAALIQFLRDLGVPLPKPMATAAEFALNGLLRREIEAEPMDIERVHSLMEQVRAAKVNLDATTLEFAVRMALERLFEQFAAEPRQHPNLLDRIEARIGIWHIPCRSLWSCGGRRISGLKCAAPSSMVLRSGPPRETQTRLPGLSGSGVSARACRLKWTDLRIPLSTYRLQFGRGFGFRASARTGALSRTDWASPTFTPLRSSRRIPILPAGTTSSTPPA